MEFGLFVPCHRFDQFILFGAFGPDHGRTMASLHRFAEDVMPHFAKGSRA